MVEKNGKKERPRKVLSTFFIWGGGLSRCSGEGQSERHYRTSSADGRRWCPQKGGPGAADFVLFQLENLPEGGSRFERTINEWESARALSCIRQLPLSRSSLMQRSAGEQGNTNLRWQSFYRSGEHKGYSASSLIPRLSIFPTARKETDGTERTRHAETCRRRAQ